MILESQANKLISLIKDLGNELNKYVSTTEFKNVISEENSLITYAERKNWEYFWLIDPIDGTKEFINKGDDYTINIALCKNKKPIFSVVYAPGKDELFHAFESKGAFKNNSRITLTENSMAKINVVTSKSHLDQQTEEFLRSLKKKYKVEVLSFGSSLKICKVAEGIADIYPRFGPTMEWDICAAHLILKEAGGTILSNSKELVYNKEDLRNGSFFCIKKGINNKEIINIGY